MKSKFVAIFLGTVMVWGVSFVQAAETKETAKGILTFRIHQVYYQDETGGSTQEKFGSDDIFMAAVTVDADKRTEVIPAFHVGQFKDKQRKVYNPLKTLATFDLSKGGDFPKGYMVKLVLVERDGAKDIPPFLDDLAGKTRQVVNKADAATNNLPTGSGTWQEEAAKIGKEIGKAIWDEARKDDFFPPEDVFIIIPRADFTWPGGKNHSPDTVVKLKAANGKYQVKYDWMITR